MRHGRTGCIIANGLSRRRPYACLILRWQVDTDTLPPVAGWLGDRNVLVHGGYTAQAALLAGLLDELQIHQVPVLSGGGRRLFEVLPERIDLEIVRKIDTPEATHIRYRSAS